MSSPGARGWEKVREELRAVFSLHDDMVLVLAVGKGDAVRAALAGVVATVLPPTLRLREFAYGPENLNPFVDFQRGVDRGQYVTLASGLSGLEPALQKKALELLNWNRGILDRGGIKLILWVEPEQVPALYRYAGDFADWWTALIELPEEAIPEPARPPPEAAPEPPRSGLDTGEPTWAARERLVQLLIELFNNEELRRFLSQMPHGENLVNMLPSSPGLVSRFEFAHRSVEHMEYQGVINERFFVHLVQVRPRRLEEIRSVAKDWGVSLEQKEPNPSAHGRPLSHTVLYMAAMVLFVSLASWAALLSIETNELVGTVHAGSSQSGDQLRALLKLHERGEDERLARELTLLRPSAEDTANARDAIFGLGPTGLSEQERVEMLPPLVMALADQVEGAEDPESFYGALLAAADMAGSVEARQAVVQAMRAARGQPPVLDPRDGSWSVPIAGTFMVGCASDAGDTCAPDESLRSVTLSPYRVRRYEESLREYRRFDNDFHVREIQPDDWPASGVSWYEATAYAAWLGAVLPTEAQWEVAARGGCEGCDPGGYRRTAWYSGSEEADLALVGFYVGNAGAVWRTLGSRGLLPAMEDLGGPPHPLGLLNIHGNVSEWTSDWYAPYPDAPSADPVGPTLPPDPASAVRTFRGGSWQSSATACRLAYRGKNPPSTADPTSGFRLALPAP